MKNLNITLLLFVYMSIGAFAQSTSEFDISVKNEDGITIYYNYINDFSVEVTRNSNIKYEGNVKIPERINDNGNQLSVTNIGRYAFLNCSGLTSVTIPNSITTIEDAAFKGCNGLISLTIPNSVMTIERHAFQNCSNLTNVIIEDGEDVLTFETSFSSSWGDSFISPPFSSCPLETLYYGRNISFTNNTSPFNGMKTLSTLTVGKDVKFISSEVFSGCTGLICVNINNDNIIFHNNEKYSTMAIIFGNQVKKYVIGEQVTSIGDYAFCQCTNMATLIIGNNVSSIGYKAFNKCNSLTSVIIPNSVKSIGQYAFEGCGNLALITIGNSVVSINDDAFENNTSLTSVTIPNSVTYIGKSAFQDCI